MNDKRRDHHYVPKLYLKNWAKEGEVWVYQKLVSHDQVPRWEKKNIRSIGTEKYLYTRYISENEYDDLEAWFEKEYETPVVPSLEKVILEQKLTREDWWHLVRFLAAQLVRTPARMFEAIERWKKGDRLLNLITNPKNKREPQLKHFIAQTSSVKPISIEQPFPMRISETGAEILNGRALWHYEMIHLLTGGAANRLHEHKWTILRPANGRQWCTSDDPVIPLVFRGYDDYHFKGGWGVENTEILLPLSPYHLMYTKVGDNRSRLKGTKLSIKETLRINRFIIERAHRMVICNEEPYKGIEEIAPRMTNEKAFKEEKKARAKWNETQRDLEKYFLQPL